MLLDVDTVLQICSIAALAGIMYQNQRTLRRDLDRLEGEIRDFRELRADMAVVKNDISSIKEMITNYFKEHS